MSIKTIKDILLSAKKIGITYHVSPDGDAVGSVLALYNGLKYLNKDCYVLSKEALSENLRFLLGAEDVTGEVYEPIDDTDVVIVLDCGNYERICANLEKDVYKRQVFNEIAAGNPIEINDEKQENFYLPKEWVDRNNDNFILQIKGG